MTTRAQAVGRLAHRLEIGTLLPEQGALFLLRRAGLIAPEAELSSAEPQEQALVKRLSQELGGLPLALDQVGAYLEETGTNLADYWHIYEQHRADLLRERGGLVADHPAPVATTWSLSFERVEEKHPAAADLLRLLAFLAPDAIPEEILTAGASSLGPVLAEVTANAFQFNQAIEVLRIYSLVRRDPKGKTISIHRLVQAVLQDSLRETQRRTWANRALCAVNATFPAVSHEMWSRCERVLPQAETVAQLVEQYQLVNEEAGRLLYETASYLQDRARYEKAELLYHQVLVILEQVKSMHLLMAFALNNLASLYYSQGKYAKSEPLCQRALVILQQQLGPENPRLASPLNNLATLYSKQGKYDLAERLYQRALAILQPLGPENLQVVSALNGLASLYRDQGEYDLAERLYQRALAIREQQLGSEHPEVASPLNGLANLYLKQGKYDLAERLYQRVLAILQQLGPDHPLVASPLNGLANLYREQGKYVQAESLYHCAHVA